MHKNKNFLIIALIAFVNALGYGIIIPILYDYSINYGLSDFENGLLFAVFSLCSFLAAPFIGRLSDKYGRKPVLVISLIGTAVSFIMMAFAPSAIFLFLARALDGITAGNMPVAAAVISDTTEPKDRTKGFGILGASFGFGFVFGPLISAFTTEINIILPFIIAAVITVLSVIITAVFLPETNKNLGVVQKGKIFDFQKLLHSMFNPNLGKIFIISFIFNIALGMMFFSYQPMAVKVIGLSVQSISLIFTLFGATSLVTQVLLISRVSKRFGDIKTLSYAIFICALGFIGMFLSRDIYLFVFSALLFSFGNSFFMPMIQSIISKSTDEKSQGSELGLNASYVSIGNIVGPIIAGALATLLIPLPFLVGGILMLASFIIALKIKIIKTKEHAF